MLTKKINLISLFIFTLTSCTSMIEEVEVTTKKGVPAYAEVTIGEMTNILTRATKNSYDNWSVSTFYYGDKVGLFCRNGIQNPENPDLYNNGIRNGEMNYEGGNGSYYRFGNSEIVMEPATVAGSFSMMYYPYYKEMPYDDFPIESSSTAPDRSGMPLRIKDTDNIEKCVDFMTTSGNQLTITNGVLKPKFTHNFFELIIQREEGFKKAPDKRIWVVLNEPFTDIRIVQYTRETNSFNAKVQYYTEESEDQLMINPIPDESRDISVNKYRLWQTWKGNNYNNKESDYVIMPPGTVSYLIIQDDNEKWQAVNNFYLQSSPNKEGKAGMRYVLTIEMVGLNAVVRPVTIQEWDEEISVTDNRKNGINSLDELSTWINLYNSYITDERNNSYNEELLKFGDAVNDELTGQTSWTFYINSDLNLPDGYIYNISRLEDKLEGSNIHYNYEITNLRKTFIEEMVEGAALTHLDFKDCYIIDIETDPSDYYSGGIVRHFNGGEISNCNIFNSVLISNKKAGIIAGSIKDVSISSIKLSGEVVGIETAASPYEGVFGENPFSSESFQNIVNDDLNFRNFQ